MKKISLMISFFLMIVLVGCTDDVEVTFDLNPGVDTIEIHTSWTDAGVDASLKGLELAYQTSGEVDTDTLGTYVITYSTEYKDETYTQVRYVFVVDQTKPVITLNPGIDTITLGSDWVDAGATVTDNSGETLTLTVLDNVYVYATGIYHVTYTATDASGNTQTMTRVVTVIE